MTGLKRNVDVDDVWNQLRVTVEPRRVLQAGIIGTGIDFNPMSG